VVCHVSGIHQFGHFTESRETTLHKESDLTSGDYTTGMHAVCQDSPRSAPAFVLFSPVVHQRVQA
jgi:hypothetical protein